MSGRVGPHLRPRSGGGRAEEHTVVAEHEAEVGPHELDLVEVRGDVVRAPVALPRPARVLRLEKRAPATHRVPPAVVDESEVQDPEAPGADLGLREALALDALVRGQVHVAGARGQPHVAVGAEAHRLDAPRRRAVVRLPVRLARPPRHVEVPAGGDPDVRAVRAARDAGEGPLVVGCPGDARRHSAVERGIDRLLHRRAPGVGRVVRGVDGARVRHHLRLALARARHDADRGARQLGRQRDALPALPAVLRVQQDGRLAHDPALLAVERHRVEAVVETLLVDGRHVALLPRHTAVVGLHEQLARAQQEAPLVVHEGDVQQHHARVEIEGDALPV